MRKRDTTGEYAIPNVEACAAARGDEPSMDSDAFGGFYQRSAPGLRAYLARVSGNPALADDLMQESYVRFLCASHPEGGEVNYRRYLYRIATNLLRDHWRRPRAASIDDVPEGFLAVGDASSRIDSQAMLDPAMAQMRPRDRQLLWLAHAEGYSHREIAEITGLREGSVRLLLYRARRKIARLLRGQMVTERRRG
ncbi:MAG TPA: sigma-70 family RNA polymerase sigma factor [Candidatus Sulfotelmatobacter sp.]|nr:sigma-70 family RNA polymerase sigma factor [Candidatus Sulfotelmatobacter sp.]